ncbi:MAG: efflux RND transporter periplasmic adaptor subunit [Planctomycetia bacterium]|nr:efflux RND transporter periplasmic adaptor subunit [Planctomycetia bacterium]
MRTLFSRWRLFGLLVVGVGCPIAWLALTTRPVSVAVAANGSKDNSAPQATTIRVETVKPQKGGIERTTNQPGSVIAFESAQLFAKVSGYLKSQAVDIGDHVERDDVLAEIDAPELLKEAEHARANLDQTKAQVVQAVARIATAKADREAALAAIEKVKADVDSAKASRDFREKQFVRFKELSKLKSIDDRLVDEQLSQMEAARAAEGAAIAGVASAKAMASAAAARIEQAEADAAEARAKVEVAQATLEKAEVFVQYLTIVSPYDGVVTKRNFFPGDFIRSADQESLVPVLAIDRTDKMRVVVQIPDPDVPFTNKDDEAVVEIDNLPGIRFSGKVSRIADSEDTKTRTMRAEIDLPNEKNLLRQGMYGYVTIQLGTLPGAVRVPSSSLVGKISGGRATVYTCKDGAAHLVSVRVGRDDGLDIEIVQGLSIEDDVIRHPSGTLSDGARVTVVSAAGKTKAAGEDTRRK